MCSFPGWPLGRHPVGSFSNFLVKLPTGCQSGGRPGKLSVDSVIGTPILANSSWKKKKKLRHSRYVAVVARKCGGVLALSSPLPRRTEGFTSCKSRLSYDARNPTALCWLLRPE